MEVVAGGLLFPEGPVAMADSSVVVVEMVRGTVSQVDVGGSIDVIAKCGGGPNGAALGPDGRLYICNNGGFDDLNDAAGHFADLGMPREYLGGSIQVVDPLTGIVETLVTECDGHRLLAPNDLVFDATGGFWFTDHGRQQARQRDHGGLYYSTPDGSAVKAVAYPLLSPNGVGLSPGGDLLYVSDTETGQVLQWEVTGAGSLRMPSGSSHRGRVLFTAGGGRRLDSLAVDSAGHVCAGVIGHGGGIYDIAPDGSAALVPTGDPLTTNLCFGGADLSTAYVTCSGLGELRSLRWPRPGLELHFSDNGGRPR